MSTRGRRTVRFVALGATAALGVGLLAAPSVAQVPEDEFRTTVPELGGYTALAQSAPVSIQLFEPVIPVPAGPGEPHGEAHGSYSRATLGSGPASRGLGSAFWPGATAGDGLSAFDPNIPPYPFKASATYPDGPYEQMGDTGDWQQDRGDPNTNTGMFAYARGIDVYGESNGSGDMVPGLFAVGNMKTISTNTVVDGVVVAETIATMQDVSIAGGIVTMDGFQTRLIARSNGETAETEGTYEVSGLEIFGVAYELTDDGLKATPPVGDPVDLPLPIGQDINQLHELIGVRVEAAPVKEEVDGPTGTRSTRGMTITIDTTPLREELGFLPINDVIEQIPDPGVDFIPCEDKPDELGFVPCYSNPIVGLKANLYTLAALQPEIRFLFGGAQVSTSAALPFEFTPPALPPLPPPPPVQNTFIPPTPTFVAPPTVAPAPQVAPPPTQPGRRVDFVALGIPDGLSRGLGAGLVLVALAGMAGGARFGKRLTMAAIYDGSAPAARSEGVPDLRAFARGVKR